MMFFRSFPKMPAFFFDLWKIYHLDRWLLVIGICLYLILSVHLPVSIFPLSGMDDALFIRNGQSISQGLWLGNYSNVTLAKGSAYPIFLAMNAYIGLPINFLNALLNLLAVSLFLLELKRWIKNPYLLVLLGFILLFHPALMPVRIMRDNIYPALTLLILAGLIRVSYFQLNKDSFLPVGFYGFFAGWFFLTREEGIWIFPAFLILLTYRFFVLRLSGEIYQKFIKPCLVYGVALLTPIILICSLNFLYFGRFVTQEFTTGYYVKVLGQLNTIVDDNEKPYVPVSQHKRAQIYKVSPAFAELQPLLEKDLIFWQVSGCEIYPKTCGDYAGGWFMWALRDAVARKGYYQTAQTAEAYYRRLSSELTQACDEKRLVCRNDLMPLMPQVQKENYSLILPKLFEVLQYLVSWNSPGLIAGMSYEPKTLLNQYRQFLGYPQSMPAQSELDTKIQGWYYGPKAVELNSWIDLICNDGHANYKMPVNRLPSPDLVSYFKDARAGMQRFAIIEPAGLSCSLLNQDAGALLPLNLIAPKSAAYALGSNTFYVDSKQTLNINESHQTVLGIKAKLIAIYHWIIPIFAVLGFLIFVVIGVRYLVKRQRPSDVFVLALSIWAIIFTRLIILLWIDLTSFPGINILYMMPIFPLLLIAAALSLCLWTIQPLYKVFSHFKK